MSTVIVTALAAVSLVVVLLALRRDAPLDAPGPATPDWDPLPTPSELARVEWPLRVPGYDPATVEQTFGVLADAYADLLHEASADAIDRARRRAARRSGSGGVAADRALAALADPAVPRRPVAASSGSVLHDGADGGDATREALRAEAVLATLRRGSAAR